MPNRIRLPRPSDQEIIDAVKTSTSFKEVSQKLNRSHPFNNRIRLLKLDTSHFRCQKPKLQKLIKWNKKDIVLNKIESYLLGLFQSDGSRSSKTSIIIELSIKDVDILYNINKYYPNTSKITYRTRNTNFSKEYKSATLTFSDIKIISKFHKFIPYGKKSDIIEAPKGIIYSEKDYWRGLIDGDGSVGFRKYKSNLNVKKPYIALNTSSDIIVNDFSKFIRKYINKKFKLEVNRNKRDNTYNIIVDSYLAIILSKLIYTNNCLSINRKYKTAIQINNFDVHSLQPSSRYFSLEDDKIIFNLSSKEAAKKLGLIGHKIMIVITRKRYLNNLYKYGLLKL